MPIGVAHRCKAPSPSDGEATTFLCPVCLAPLLGERGLFPRPCHHLLLVEEEGLLAYWRDERVRQAHADSGPGAAARLAETLGRNAVFFDLLGERAQGSTVTVAIEYAPRREQPRGARPERVATR